MGGAVYYWMVVSITFYVHSCLGKSSNLMSIFFNWVGSTTNFLGGAISGVIKLPLLGGIKQYQMCGHFEGFPLSQCVAWVGNTMTPAYISFRQDADYYHVPGF